ncbi:unnamed protein product [Penicillium glandicola]
MVLDPGTSLAVVGVVIQFVESGCKLFSKSREFYKSTTGALADDLELQSIAQQLDELAGSARFLPSLSDNPGTSRGEKLLLEISQGCKEQAKKLDDVLRPIRTSVASPALPLFKTKGDSARPSKMEAFRVALRRMKKSGEIDRIAKRLDTYGQQLSTCLTMIFCDQNSAIWRSMQELYGSMSKETNEEVQKQLKSISNAVNGVREYLTETEGLISLFRFGTSKVDELDETLSSLHGWLKASEKLSKQARLLDSLSYRAIEERQSQIRESHAQTFEWVFDTQGPSKSSESSILEWQETGNGIYWVSGKAGSGKSTLMKFLSTHRLTNKALRSWAGSDRLITASFFFWNSGTTLQKSQEGLLRSLLHEILQKYPVLIEEVFPPESHEDTEKSTGTFTNNWSRSQLIDAFFRLASLKISSSKFCFFIDGLDEYHGDHVELVNLLCELVRCNPNVKLVVSSRPWNAFQVTFGDGKYPSLTLEDLTRDDISLYVQAKLGEHETYRKYILENSLRGIDLVHEVVSKANGVFLWVYLVVRSLQRGLENEDRLPDLQRRLQALPTDLEEYFRHMLDNIDPLYKVEAAKCFDIALQSRRALTLLTFSFLDEENPVNMTLASPIKPLKSTEIKSRHRAMAKRLNARCQDLLEITTEKPRSASLNAREALFRQPEDEIVSISQVNGNFPVKDFGLYRVDFLHRTVRDFLCAAEMREVFSSRLPTSFDSVTWLCASFVQQLKSIPSEKRSADFDQLFVTLFDNAMDFARESEVRGHDPRPQTDLLDELERVCAIFHAKFGPRFLDLFLRPQHFDAMLRWNNKFEKCFLEICVRKDLVMYVQERLRDGPKTQDRDQISTLLLCALFPHTMQKPVEGNFEVPNPRMVQLLLDRGADPNWGYDYTQSENTWLHFIKYIAQSWPNTDISSHIVMLKVIKKLLDHGATISSERGPKAAWVDFLVMHGENWEYCGQSEEFQTLLCELIEITVARVDVNICYKGCTVWGHFVNNLPRNMPRRTKLRVLRTVEAFLRNGADPYFDYSIGLGVYKPWSKQQGDRPVGSELLRIFTGSELTDSGMPGGSIPTLQHIETEGIGMTIPQKPPQPPAQTQVWWKNVPRLWKWAGGGDNDSYI